jgi:hopene-associated glycosyltransferase HpnB
MLAVLSLLAWLYLILAHGKFWESAPELAPATPSEFPDVDIIVPARDEAETIGPVIASLLSQDYGGRFCVTLVDDNSTDGTATAAGVAPKLLLIPGLSKPSGWSGKLWALSQGIAVTSAPVLFFTDADVIHHPGHLSALVARLLQPRVEMVSEMVRLNCTSVAERALVPAFVYFFQMLYPFSKVNDPLSAVAAAAGGTVLLRRATLERIGGIDAIKSALIDDVTLARAVKKLGPIYLGHSALAVSARRYPAFADLWRVISRSAFTQLRYSVLLLVLTILGLSLILVVPAWEVLFGHGWDVVFGLAAFTLAIVSYLPTLERYGQSSTLSLTLPLIAFFFMSATVGSALSYWRGKRASWKNRVYGVGQ